MQRVYFDNAATSYPKPKQVIESMMSYMIDNGGSANRGSSSISLHGTRMVYECRYELSNFFNFPKCENVIFTNNITTSLNMLLLGMVKPNWHIITTSMEHNSVIRPLINLSNTIENVTLDIINCNKYGFVNINDIREKINSNTKLIILSHASNLVGSIQPIKEIGMLCKEKGIFFILDSAQTAGVIPINMKDLNLSALAFTGHKSLLGPQGTGGFIIDDSLNEVCSPIFIGGTGSNSSQINHPLTLPDKFECGTHNTPGIVGLLEGIKFINKIGITNIKEKEEYLCEKTMNDLLNIPNLKIYGTLDSLKKTSTISFNLDKIDSSEVGYLLDTQFNIACRTGLHCTPLAHKTVGSYPNGSIRISLGYFNTDTEIDYFIDSINKISKK